MNLIPLTGLGEVLPGDNLANLLIAALESQQLVPEPGDVLVVAQKIVSKAEDRYVDLASVIPSAEAVSLAIEVDKDPALVQLILNESVAVVRKAPGVLIVRHLHGYVHANAGIDRSNLPVDGDRERVLLLPENPDASARQLVEAISTHFDCPAAVIINDSAGRPFREGTAGFAIGAAGFNPLVDLVGKQDRNGRVMETTQVAVGDELAAAASYLMGQADEGIPVVLIKGAAVLEGDYDSKALIRDKGRDLFRR